MEYSNLLFKPFDKESLVRLEQYPEFQFKHEHKDGLIAYMILCYDLNSDLVKLYPDNLTRRKRESALKAGFKLNRGGKFEEWLENVMIGKNDSYNLALVRFTRLFGITDYPVYVAYNEILAKELEASYSVQDSKERKDVIANIEKTRNVLSEIQRKMFSGDETVDVLNMLYYVSEQERIGLRPEDIARAIHDKTINLSDPQKIYAWGDN